MAYNNFFPASYQPFNYQQQYIPQYSMPNPQNNGDFSRPLTNTQPMQTPSQNDFKWVSGEAGGKGYPVAPNQTVTLWDSEAPVIYIKSADMNGMPTIKILDYTVRGEAKKNELLQTEPQIDLSGYVTKEEFEKRIAEIGSRETTAKKVKKDE